MTELPPLPAASRTADAGGVTVRVAPLLTDEESQDFFEANLPVAGVLPVRVELAFQSGVPVETKAGAISFARQSKSANGNYSRQRAPSRGS